MEMHMETWHGRNGVADVSRRGFPALVAALSLAGCAARSAQSSSSVARMGSEGQHLRLDIADKHGKYLKLVAFYAPENWLNLSSEARIEPLVKLTDNEWNGVHSLADYTTQEALTKQSQRTFNRCTKLAFAETEVNVSICLNIAFGCNIPEVTANVQTKVSAVISDMIGYTVGQINITIADVIMA